MQKPSAVAYDSFRKLPDFDGNFAIVVFALVYQFEKGLSSPIFLNYRVIAFLKSGLYCLKNNNIPALDLPDPVIEKDEDGRRKHFHFTDFEKKFLLDTPINELCQLVEAARSLDIRSQYVYGTQAAYSMLHKAIKSRKPKRIAETMRALGMDQNSLAQHLTQRGHT